MHIHIRMPIPIRIRKTSQYLCGSKNLRWTKPSSRNCSGREIPHSLLGVGRSIGAPMQRDTKFDDIRIITNNQLTMILKMLISKIIRNHASKIFLACINENESKPWRITARCVSKANWKQVGSTGMLWHTCLLRGDGSRSTDKTKVYCFVLD